MKKKALWIILIVVLAAAVAAGGYFAWQSAHTHSLSELLPLEAWAHVEGVAVSQSNGGEALTLPEPEVLRAKLADFQVREAKAGQTLPDRFYVLDIYTAENKVSLQVADNGDIVVVYLDKNASYRDGGKLFAALSEFLG